MDLHTHTYFFFTFLHLFVSINFSIFVVYFFSVKFFCDKFTKASFDHTSAKALIKLCQLKFNTDNVFVSSFTWILFLLCVSKRFLSTHITHIHTSTKQHLIRGFCSFKRSGFFWLVNLILMFFLHWTKFYHSINPNIRQINHQKKLISKKKRKQNGINTHTMDKLDKKENLLIFSIFI